MENFVSNSDANALMSEIGKKKLTVTDVMPLAASAANEGIPYLYLGATTQDFSNGSIYECQEVTPATDPKTYEWVEKYQSSVDLTYYKRIWGGTEDGWNQLTDEQKANYEYTFFNGDSDYTLDVVDAVTDGDMRPVTSNAVADQITALNDELYFKSGDSYKDVFLSAGGSNNNGKNVDFDIYVPKSLKNITSVSASIEYTGTHAIVFNNTWYQITSANSSIAVEAFKDNKIHLRLGLNPAISISNTATQVWATIELTFT